jgi:hypothetical protein
MRLIRSLGRPAWRILKIAMCAVWGLAGLSLLYYAAVALYI